MAQAIQDVFEPIQMKMIPGSMGKAKEAEKEIARKIQLCGSSGRAWDGIR